MTRQYNWHKSSYSDPQANCVEVARVPAGGIAVRDSKDPNGPVLRFDARDWNRFVERIKAHG
jgi:Domain of unknown function (DUF397)